MQITVCDLCGGKPCERIYLQTGWLSDPAGGPSIKDETAFDLCLAHTASIARALSRAKSFTFEDAQSIVAAFNQRKKD
jgi:hypothetical protein